MISQPLPAETLKDKLNSIQLLLLDVDGVMTDGRLLYHPDGGESKSFHVRDGLGLRLLMESGIRAGIVTGRVSAAVRKRCSDLRIDMIYEGILNKAGVLADIVKTTGVGPEHIGFIGDDIIDLPLIRLVGFSAAPADAHPLVRDSVDLVTRTTGGNGVVREVIENILHAQERWNWALDWFYKK
jgi:3-deoxy-D-manno-octulosonate 8-phosphate phosphatase (KDO 8-P phosphatase)